SELRGTFDTPYAHALAKHVGSDHADVVLSTEELIDPENADRVPRARDLPGLGEGDTSLYLLFKAIRAQSTVALSGESADEVFGGYLWFHDERMVQANDFPWIAALAAFTGGPVRTTRHSFLAPDLLRQLDVPGYVADSYRTAL